MIKNISSKLTGCVVDQPPQRSVYVAPSAVDVALPVMETPVVVQDDYRSRRHQYAYANQGSSQGHEVQPWLVAESELLAERNLTRIYSFHNKT
jgi:hypothetical protein